MRRYFGTDGIRGRVGGEIINPEFVLRLGWAVGQVLSSFHSNAKVLIGKDTRISGYLLESVLEAGLSSSGTNAWMLGPMPTPAVAYLTRTFRAQAGIVISASHNPYYDNGIKFFSPAGSKLPDELELAIEKMLDKPMKLVDASALGKAKRITDAPGRYIEFCKSTLGLKNSLNGLKLVVDCAHGATYHVAPSIFRELGAKVVELGAQPDGFNINQNCGSTHPEALAAAVLAHQADLGVAFDGDGDRVIMVDHQGEVVDGDELLFIIAAYEAAEGRLVGGVIGTVMSNLGLEEGLNRLGLAFQRTPVGDRYVIEALQQKNWQLGGESSGHIAHLGVTTTGDGIIAALQVLKAISARGRTLCELKNEMDKYPQVLINVSCNNPRAVGNDERVVQAGQRASQKMAARGRILLRPSGTEPVVRVMVEGRDEGWLRGIAEEVAAQVSEVAREFD